jgi:hypothetical protein
MTNYDVQLIAQLLRRLPPAPEGWTRAAQELPQARAAMNDIVARAEADGEYRARVVADLEAALQAEGVEAAPSAVAALRLRLGS